MTDTDSLLLHIKCDDIYKELKYLQNKYDCFDFSEFDKIILCMMIKSQINW